MTLKPFYYFKLLLLWWYYCNYHGVLKSMTILKWLTQPINACMCPLPAHWLAIPISFSYAQRYNTTGVGHIKNAKITFKYSSGRNTSNSYSRWKTRNNQSQVEKCVQNRGRQMASSIETVIFWMRRVRKMLKFPLQWLHIHNSKTERACYW